MVLRASQEIPVSQGRGLSPSEENRNQERPVAQEGAKAVLKVPASPQDIRAGWLVGSLTNLCSILVLFVRHDTGTGTSPCFDKYVSSTEVMYYQNIPSQLQERHFVETFGCWKMRGRVGKCEWLARVERERKGNQLTHEKQIGELHLGKQFDS